ncbi:MAG TPA: hypothetical protein H9742_05290 [Candidatus Acetatifactor stercoripullorum]|uniref:DUF5104 domain-containing protein n=1 Tax=Candidatus Acetatifactor stercoripullorum TaxID=2838414 RepID=A0A9D1R4T8_9FIRM|nr:hypothetical protein [uncultured Acetatifactor sp.]HIW80934.1 hypothetical protein [Candidatus Acetatifactor stercoripullorum]
MGKRMCALFLLAAFLLTACGSEERAEARDVREAFVEMFFTSDYQNRYSAMSQEADWAEEYYQDFSEAATQECLEQMAANREPFKYDRLAEEKGEKITVESVSFSVYDQENKVYTFEAVLKSDAGGKTYQANGQITLQEEEGKEKVSHFYVGSYEELE